MNDDKVDRNAKLVGDPAAHASVSADQFGLGPDGADSTVVPFIPLDALRDPAVFVPAQRNARILNRFRERQDNPNKLVEAKLSEARLLRRDRST